MAVASRKPLVLEAKVCLTIALSLTRVQEDCAAIFLGQPTMCGWLVNKPSTTGKETPLHAAAQFGQTSMVLALLAAGADPTLKDCDGWTPDKSAKKAGHKELAKQIADALMQNMFGGL